MGVLFKKLILRILNQKKKNSKQKVFWIKNYDENGLVSFILLIVLLGVG